MKGFAIERGRGRGGLQAISGCGRRGTYRTADGGGGLLVLVLLVVLLLLLFVLRETAW